MKNLFIMNKTSRKASGLIQSEFEGLRIKEANGINTSLRAGKDEISSLNSISKAGKRWGGGSKFLLSIPIIIYLGPQWIG